MRVAFLSNRPFEDGPVSQPFLESDPANIAYVVGGPCCSHLTVRWLSHQALTDTLRPFDLVFVPLDMRSFTTVQEIIAACRDRVATYSEGSVSDYQTLSPEDQVRFVHILRNVAVNFVYWERYVPFYRSLTDVPTEYLPYPYLLEEARKQVCAAASELREVTLPSGLVGGTRNGLCSIAVSRELLRCGLVDRVNCWLTPGTFAADAQAIASLLFGQPLPGRPLRGRLSWRHWLARSGVDYRALLRLSRHLGLPRRDRSDRSLVYNDRVAFHRR